jgi:hypothetical protein
MMGEFMWEAGRLVKAWDDASDSVIENDHRGIPAVVMARIGQLHAFSSFV